MRQEVKYLKNILVSLFFGKSLKKTIDPNKRKAFIFEVSINGNMGDQAISIAQYNYIKKYLPGFQIIEIPANEVYTYYKHIQEILEMDDILFIQGGGNVGNLYLSAEKARTFIIKKFKNNRIVSFPQSVFFTENLIGDIELKRSIKIYERNKNLFLFARDKDSFDFFNKNFVKTKKYLCPDIVFSMDLPKNKLDSDTICTLLRNDIEKKDSSDISQAISNWCTINDIEVIVSDTMKPELGNNAFENRETYLKEMILEIVNSKVVVTDRLHGMILSYLTGTPCLALNNSYGKVEKTYTSWLSKNEYIDFFDGNEIDENKFHFELSKLYNLESVNFTPLIAEFSSLDDIVNFVEKEIVSYESV